MAKGTVVASKAVKREKGYMYFVDGEGSVRKTKMGKKSAKKAAPKKAAKKAAPKKAAVKKKTTTKKK